MRIALVSPPLDMPARAIQLYYPNGLLHVAASWRAMGHEVSIVDAPAEGWANERHDAATGRWHRGLEIEEVVSRITATQPELVGVTIPFSVLARPAYKIADAVRSRLGVPVIAGGHHASVRAEKCLEHFDAVVVGEGEAVDPADLLTSVGVVRGPRIESLVSIAFPARDLVPMDSYFHAAKSGFIHGIGGIERWASVITSRGCPFNCCFCAINLTMGKKWRGRTAANVLLEAEKLRSDYGVDCLVFEDDNMTFDNQRATAIFEGLEAMGGFRLFAPNGLRADTLDAKLLVAMKDAGFDEIWISPESGSQRVVNQVIGKRMDLGVVERVVREGTTIGLGVSCFFVVGTPGETLDEVRQTVAFKWRMQDLGMHRYAWGYATPYWGTKLHADCQAAGMLDGFDDSAVSPGTPTINNPALPVAKLAEIVKGFSVR